MAKAQTPAEMQKKYKDLLETNGSLICTEDGQAFYNTAEGKLHASNYCAANKVQSFELKAAKKEAKKKTKKNND